MVKYVCAIDPGLQGGIVVTDHHAKIHMAMRMPTWTPHRRKAVKHREVFVRIKQTIESGSPIYFSDAVIVIEDVTPGAVPGKQSAFSFGRSLGLVEAACHDLGYMMRYVAAATWKKKLHLLKGTKQDAMDRATAIYGREAQQQHWPHKADDGVAEAALIAYWWMVTNPLQE